MFLLLEQALCEGASNVFTLDGFRVSIITRLRTCNIERRTYFVVNRTMRVAFDMNICINKSFSYLLAKIGSFKHNNVVHAILSICGSKYSSRDDL
jgi:hypothetical protein